MAAPKRRKPPSAKSVFVNCPFDEEFKPIFRAIVFAVFSCGYFPRCALDSTDSAEPRVSKIADMIGYCNWGIHDLSRVEVDPQSGTPRFNMPLELGLHLGARLFGDARQKRKRALILEADRHRYDVSISDISGQDIEAHDNQPAVAIRVVRNWLSEHRPHNAPPLPGATTLVADYEAFNVEVADLLIEARLDSLAKLPHNDFLFVVSDWLERRAVSLRQA